MDIFDSDSSSTENEEIEKNDQQKDNDLCLSEISRRKWFSYARS